MPLSTSSSLLCRTSSSTTRGISIIPNTLRIKSGWRSGRLSAPCLGWPSSLLRSSSPKYVDTVKCTTQPNRGLECGTMFCSFRCSSYSPTCASTGSTVDYTTQSCTSIYTSRTTSGLCRLHTHLTLFIQSTASPSQYHTMSSPSSSRCRSSRTSCSSCSSTSGPS